MQKNNIAIFESLFESKDLEKARKKVLNIRHREFNIIDSEDEIICLSSSSTFATKNGIYQRRIIKIIKHL